MCTVLVVTACGAHSTRAVESQPMRVSPERPTALTTAPTLPPNPPPAATVPAAPPAPPPTPAQPTEPPTLPVPTSPPVVVPVLGNPNWAPYSMGFGQVRPDGLSSGGDPSGIIDDVTWDGWGGSTASGHGTAVYVRPNETVAAASSYPAVIVAFDPGDCEGRFGYRKVTWYFPQFGDSFDPTSAWDVCTPA